MIRSLRHFHPHSPPSHPSSPAPAGIPARPAAVLAARPAACVRTRPTIFSKEVFMNDIRRSVLWVIFGFSMILLWDKWQVHNGNRALFFPAPAPTAPAASAGARPASADAAHGPAAAAGGGARPASAEAAQAGAPAAGASPDAVPGQPAVSGQPAAVPVARERVQVQTDLYRLTFDSQG